MFDLYIRRMSLREPLPAGSYLNRLPVVRYLAENGIDFHSQVTFFVGENGSGKSTLIEALAISQGFNPEGGTKNFSFSTEDSHSELCNYLRVARGPIYPRDGFFLRAESFYNVASNIDQMDREPGPGRPVICNYGGISLHKQSHGESFLALLDNRFKGRGLYILDEPEAALSPTGIIRLLKGMDQLVSKDSQFIISTHSPMLMTFPGAEIFQIQEEGITSVPYQETDHYKTTLRFWAAQNAPQGAAQALQGASQSDAGKSPDGL